MTVHLLSGGAAKGIVTALRARFTAETGADIGGVFSAVGVMKDRYLAGEPCDVLILTEALIEGMTKQGLLLAGSSAPIGAVRTGVAVPTGFPVPAIASTAAFAAAMTAAETIYVPDPVRSTAGIHFVSMLQKLGLDRELGPRLRAFPNGETAMRQLAEEREDGAVGCTQMTEIKMTKGLTLVGPLPKEHDLSTVYVAAVSATAPKPDLARRLIALLTGAESRPMRAACGFEV